MENEKPKVKNVVSVGKGVKHIARVQYPHFRLPDTTTEALRASLKNLPTAEQGVMTARTVAGKVANNKKFMPVIATDPKTGNSEVTAVLTKKYAVVQHAEVFKKLIDAVNLYDNKVQAQTISDFKRAYLFVSMPKKFTFKAPDGKDLTLGFSATNSYNGTTGVVIGAFGYRLACQNGMLLTKTLGGMSVDHITGVHKRLDALFGQMEHQIATLNNRIEQAMEAKIALAHAEAFAEHFTGKDNARIAMETFKKEGGHSVWALYNSFTDLYSHAETNPRNRLLQIGKAEDLLINPAEVIRQSARLHEIRVIQEEEKKRTEAEGR